METLIGIHKLLSSECCQRIKDLNLRFFEHILSNKHAVAEVSQSSFASMSHLAALIWDLSNYRKLHGFALLKGGQWDI